MNNKIKVLLVEDDTTLSLLLKFRLQKEGYLPLVAHDGKQAVEIIGNDQPDIILSDIMLPFISGLEVISHVRNELNLSIPILIFSAAGQEEMVLKAFDLGANDFMAKPFSPNELMIRIKRILQNSGQAILN